MAKRSAKKYYNIIAKAMSAGVQRCDDMDVIAAGGGIAIKATDNACGQYLQQIGLMDFRGAVHEDRKNEGLEVLYNRQTAPCVMTPYFLKVSDHIVRLMMCPDTKTIIAVKYEYTKLINAGDTVHMTKEQDSKLLISLAEEDDVWDGAEVIMMPMVIKGLPEIEPIKEHLSGWRFV